MKRTLLAATAVLALAGPLLAYAAPDEAQRQMMQRSCSKSTWR
ncbi:MAG: lipoprotein [Anaerolineae bacterium]|nr:lipoprotein [Anaerolineae bacterium]